MENWRLPDKEKEPSIPEKKALRRRYTFPIPPPKICQWMNITVKFCSFRMNLDIQGNGCSQTMPSWVGNM